MLYCPAELALPIPAKVQPGPAARISANAEGDAYLDAKDAREDLLADRLADAWNGCGEAKAARDKTEARP